MRDNHAILTAIILVNPRQHIFSGVAQQLPDRWSHNSADFHDQRTAGHQVTKSLGYDAAIIIEPIKTAVQCDPWLPLANLRSQSSELFALNVRWISHD